MLMQFKALFFLSLFLASFVICQNSSNQTNDTERVIEHHLWAWSLRDIEGVLDDFAWDAYVLDSGNLISGTNDIWDYIANTFYYLNYSGCAEEFIADPFFLNQAAHITLNLWCQNYTVKAAKTFQVEDGQIKYMIVDSVFLPTSSNSSNTTNSTNSTNNTWDIAVSQFSAWGRGDVYAILNDYSSDAFVIQTVNGSRTEIFQGYWNLHWVFEEALNQMQYCGSPFWQFPVVKSNIIYLVWVQKCDGRKVRGTHTLVVNDNGLIGSLIISSVEVWERRPRREFFN